MVPQRRLLNLLTMLILLSLFAVACERPLGGTDDTATTDTAGETADPNQGGGTDGDQTTPTDTTTTDASGGETTPTGAPTDTTQDSGETPVDTADEAPADDQSTGDDTTAQPSDDANAGTTTDSSDTSDNTAADGTADAVTTDTTADTSTDTAQSGGGVSIPETHTVAAGENLYRIGLKYGISWVAIANENNLANPNVLTVGQVLKLPGAAAPTPQPTPSPQTETTYIVQAGDNLFRIGLKFGISWVQIAEANGLVNPNLIAAGDELKIPVDAPGPAPAFSHVVKQGETLFLISLQYGVAWPTIAEANNLTSPYVIYVGQTLEIPGSQ
ncbi:MAG: LysM peptidoglycan-binding domain-containing protein [Anaerolineales bacterium]|nr:LysM peptidoglycan-binding domain-containing protein [Anaerolineales bacterium]MCB8939177.1 LysM peptidoglycan-binding domain-containing protein [Ardenticatenaceae bacterium]